MLNVVDQYNPLVVMNFGLIGEVPQNCRFLDVGAHEGFYSLEAAMRGLIVKAVEWDPVQAIILDANIKLNGNPDIRVVRQVPVGVPGEGLLGNQRTINQLTTGWDHWAVRLGHKAPVEELISHPNWLQITDWLMIQRRGDQDPCTGIECVLEEKGFSITSVSDLSLVAKRSNLSIDV